jgi:hypothetical protein
MLKYKKTIAIMAIFSLIVNGFVQFAEATSLTSASDKLSESDLSAPANHAITFTTHTSLSQNDYIEVVLPAGFSNIISGQISCSQSMINSAQTVKIARCTVPAGGLATATVVAIGLSNVINPNTAGSQTLNIATYRSSMALVEEANVMVAIIDNVDVTARVASTLTFTISPLATSTNVNGQNTTATAATTSLSFGTLPVGTSTILGQGLSVVTNADDGYAVTVEQNQNLTSNAGSDIDSFVDGTPGAPQAWQAPVGTLDQEQTYGHFGFTSEDSTLTAGDTFGVNLWEGFSTSTPVQVLRHDGPADGTTADKGYTKVAYRIQITALQEAGDYSNELTYIATPTY